MRYAVHRHSGCAQTAEGRSGLHAHSQHVCLQNCSTHDKPSGCSAVLDVNPQGPAAGRTKGGLPASPAGLGAIPGAVAREGQALGSTRLPPPSSGLPLRGAAPAGPPLQRPPRPTAPPGTAGRLAGPARRPARLHLPEPAPGSPAGRPPQAIRRGLPPPPARPRTVSDELGRELLDELGDPLPLALRAAPLDLRLQPRARLLGGHGRAGPMGPGGGRGRGDPEEAGKGRRRHRAPGRRQRRRPERRNSRLRPAPRRGRAAAAAPPAGQRRRSARRGGARPRGGARAAREWRPVRQGAGAAAAAPAPREGGTDGRTEGS